MAPPFWGGGDLLTLRKDYLLNNFKSSSLPFPARI
jgi:hypothetical protein